MSGGTGGDFGTCLLRARAGMNGSGGSPRTTRTGSTLGIGRCRSASAPSTPHGLDLHSPRLLDREAAAAEILAAPARVEKTGGKRARRGKLRGLFSSIGPWTIGLWGSSERPRSSQGFLSVDRVQLVQVGDVAICQRPYRRGLLRPMCRRRDSSKRAKKAPPNERSAAPPTASSPTGRSGHPLTLPLRDLKSRRPTRHHPSNRQTPAAATLAISAARSICAVRSR
jgi:hypothetical protein